MTDTVDCRMSELQLIASMYPNSLYFFDENVATYIEETADDATLKPEVQIDDLVSIDFVFSLVNFLADVYITLPPHYPEESKLKAHIRLLDTVKYSSSELKRLQVKVNDSVKEFMENTSSDMVNVLTLIQWVEDYFAHDGLSYAKKSVEEDEATPALHDNSTVDNEREVRCEAMTSTYSLQDHSSEKKDKERDAVECRLWIYSHHIYSSKKRRTIGNLAHQLNLSGFCRPGKPGFICVEGTEAECSDFWLKCRSENWQRISLIERSLPANESLFSGFHEIAMTQSDFFKFLKDLRCDDLIRSYLGI